MTSRPNTPAKLLAVSIQLALASGYACAADARLPTVEVRATADKDSAYIATRSSAGAKTDTPILETPQSVSVVTSEQFTTQGAGDLMDALGYTAGVTRLEANDKTTDGFMLRGFSAGAGGGSMYRDGAKFMVNVYDGKQELYGLERIEVLKGAASVLYGAAAPGGIINTVSKRARADMVNEVNLEVGNLSRKQLTADVGGALDPAGQVYWRVTTLLRDSGTMTDHVDDDRIYIAPTLTWQLGANTSLSLLSHYQRDNTAYNYALPVEGTIAPNPNGALSRHLFTGEPGYDKYKNTQYSAGYQLDHKFSENTRLHHGLRYFKTDIDFPSTSLYGWAPGAGAAGLLIQGRGAQDRTDESHMATADAFVEHKLQTGALSHRILLGGDYTYQFHSSERYNRTIAPINMFEPVYGAQPGAQRQLFDWYPDTKQRRAGAYLQDQMKLDRLVLLAGVRHDNTNETTAPLTPPKSWSKEKNSDWTGRAGAVYLFDNGLAPFASWSQSFEPASGVDKDGNRFKPTHGEQFEAGVRYQPGNGSTMLSATAYQLTQSDVLAPDPNAPASNPGAQIQVGEIRSRGFEFEARTALTKQVNLVAAYAYTDARITRMTIPSYIGKRQGGVPYNQLSLWADYSAPFGVQGLKAGLGARYVGETVGTWVAGKIPAATIADAMVSYDYQNWRLALNVRNLADKNYIASCTYGCFFGASREIKLNAGYRF
jgi:iron complex outermembrane receptor protein